MYPIERVLVALDLTKMDDSLIRYAHMLTSYFPINTIYFVYVTRSLKLPKGLRQQHPELLAPQDEHMHKNMRERVATYFDMEQKKPTLVIEVREGTPTEKLLRWAKIKMVDLILLGRKATLKGGGVVSKKVANEAPCSVLFVPEKPPQHLDRILVPTDFSANSKMAVNLAQSALKNKKGEIICQHLYQVPTGYHYTGKTFSEFSEIMKHHAKRRHQHFSKDLGLEESYSCEFSEVSLNKQAHKICSRALELSVDAIFIGSKGRKGIASFLLGSTAEKTLDKNQEIPLFIIKKRNANLSFVKALLQV
jgi:nucleotide-binding universal stress UspA family protein